MRQYPARREAPDKYVYAFMAESQETEEQAANGRPYGTRNI
jgi:hypothetical protein